MVERAVWRSKYPHRIEPELANWSSDASELIRAFAVLAWPIVVGVIAWHLRGELPQLVRRLRRLRVVGAEADLDPQVQQLEQDASEAEAEVRPQLPTTTPPPKEDVTDAVLQLAAQDSRLGVVKLVTEIEVRVRDLASATGHPNPARVPWHELVQWLVEQGTVPRRFASATDLIGQVRNRIVHGQGRAVRDVEVAATIEAGLLLLRVLDAIPEYGYEVRDMVPVFQDEDATVPHEGVQGVVLWELDVQGKRRKYHVYPTRRTYTAGERVGWQWSFEREWDEAFWRDRWDDDQVRLAWSRSAEFVGQRLLRQE